jgi:hypothetical protein
MESSPRAQRDDHTQRRRRRVGEGEEEVALSWGGERTTPPEKKRKKKKKKKKMMMEMWVWVLLRFECDEGQRDGHSLPSLTRMNWSHKG